MWKMKFENLWRLYEICKILEIDVHDNGNCYHLSNNHCVVIALFAKPAPTSDQLAAKGQAF
jgi:hypothetical protein